MRRVSKVKSTRSGSKEKQFEEMGLEDSLLEPTRSADTEEPLNAEGERGMEPCSFLDSPVPPAGTYQ